MFNEDKVLSDEELLEITGGQRFDTNTSVISNPTIIRMKYGIYQPLYGIKPLYGIQPSTIIE